MKRFYICVLTLFFAAMQIVAAPVDPERALEIANDFWASNVSLKKRVRFKLVPAEGALKASSRTTTSKEHDAYYVFTGTDNNGFVIVSGDDRLNPIVGYSTSSISGKIPPALTAWLDEYSEYVNDVRTGKTEPSLQKARQTSPHIEPMLVSAWDQDTPYNNMCPILSNGKRGYTGCGNTATAQVMKFHNWPASPIADVMWKNNITGTTEICEMKSHVYDWDNMLYNYNSEYSEAQGNAVALLMADLGKATQTMYTIGMSGNTAPDIAHALVHVFNYSPELFIAERCNYTYEEYIALVRENLNNRQPIVYCGYGQNLEVGHGFVCDGIDENDLLHIDWGWNGLFNGYFDMAIMEPGGNGIGGFSSRYNVNQHAIMNIKPRAEGEVNKGGNLSLDRMNVFDMNTWESVDEISCEYVDGMAEVGVSYGLVNISHSDVEGSIGFGILDKDGNLVKDIEFGNTGLYPISLEQSYKNGFTIEVSNVNGSEDYLPAGKYIVCLFFMNTEEEVEYIRSACNGLILEVTENAITLSSPKPSYELGEFRIIKMPEHSNEKFVFNATFADHSKINNLVTLVPVINHYENGVKVKSEVKTDAAVTTMLLDTNNILVTFTIPNAFAQSGTYTISFEYIYKGNTDNHIDTDKLKSVAGESAPFEAEIIPVDVDKLDYSFSVEFIGQETEDETEVAILRATMGADISEYKFFVTNSINEDTLKAIAEDIISGKCENCYTMKRSANLRLLLGAGEYAIVIVTYDIDGKPLNGYYTQVFSLTTGLEKIEDKGSEIHIDWNNSVISVAKDGIIELLDASGRVVKRVNGNNISIADLETGIYIVKYNEDIVKVVKR